MSLCSKPFTKSNPLDEIRFFPPTDLDPVMTPDVFLVNNKGCSFDICVSFGELFTFYHKYLR